MKQGSIRCFTQLQTQSRNLTTQGVKLAGHNIKSCTIPLNNRSTIGLSFRIRRDSEKRTQAAADLDDLLQAFDKLYELDNIPDIFCEATDLVILPPIVVDHSVT